MYARARLHDVHVMYKGLADAYALVFTSYRAI